MGKRTALLGVLIALALILSYVESLIPIPLPIPGIKLGLANIVSIAALYRLGVKEGFAISFIRILLSGLLFGNLFSIVYSLSGGVLSYLTAFLLYRTQQFSVAGVSMGAAVAHNLGQLIVASLVLENAGVFYYGPPLMVAGLVTGLVTGLILMEVLKRLRKEEAL